MENALGLPPIEPPSGIRLEAVEEIAVESRNIE
jgi:hypothetical protein